MLDATEKSSKLVKGCSRVPLYILGYAGGVGAAGYYVVSFCFLFSKVGGPILKSDCSRDLGAIRDWAILICVISPLVFGRALVFAIVLCLLSMAGHDD